MDFFPERTLRAKAGEATGVLFSLRRPHLNFCQYWNDDQIRNPVLFKSFTSDSRMGEEGLFLPDLATVHNPEETAGKATLPFCPQKQNLERREEFQICCAVVRIKKPGRCTVSTKMMFPELGPNLPIFYLDQWDYINSKNKISICL